MRAIEHAIIEHAEPLVEVRTMRDVRSLTTPRCHGTVRDVSTGDIAEGRPMNLDLSRQLRRIAAASAGGWLDDLGLRVECAGNAVREAYARQTSTTPGYGVVDLGDALVRYRMHGAGPALVFIADPPVVLEQYDELVGELAHDFTVIVAESPGFGFSTFRTQLDFSFAGVTDGVLRFLLALDRAPYVLAFPCVSAYSALAIARLRPDLVTALVLAQAPSWSEELRWKARVDPQHVLRTRVLGQLALRAVGRRIYPAWFELASGSRERSQHFTATADEAFRRGAGFSLASVFQRYLVEGAGPPPVDCDALFLWGLGDRSHRRTDRASSLTLAPRGRLIESTDVGHFPELESPAWFGCVLREFLGPILTRSGS